MAAPPEPISRILIVDDDEAVANLAAAVHARPDRQITVAPTGAAALDALRSSRCAVVLLDIFLPDMDGLDLMRQAKSIDPDLVVLVMSGQGSIDLAVRAMKEEAFDFIRKPFESNQALRQAVQWALDYRKSRPPQEPAVDSSRPAGERELVAGSAVMQVLLERLGKLAESDANILLEGESGTGKEVLARYVHRRSPRAGGPFVVADCGAFTPGLVESELFGHLRGAFTGADRATPGLLRSADGGTLFLDEVSELPLELQSRLLRFLQEREVRPVGDVRATEVNVRVVAATNRDLEAMVAAGKFRLDLLYRLNSAVCQVPPLRDRLDDLPLLLRHFARLHMPAGENGSLTFNPRAMQRLREHGWPGNVRELENLVLQTLAVRRSGPVGLSDLPAKIRDGPAHQGRASSAPKTARPALSLEAYERAAIERALAETGQNVEAAARLLNIAVSSMYRKMKDLGIRKGARPQGGGQA